MIVNDQNKTAVPVNTDPPQQGVTPTEPQKVFNKERAYDFVYTLNEQNGGKMSEQQIAKYANEFVNKRWFNVYRAAGAVMPARDYLDSTYNSFFDIPEAQSVDPQSQEEQEPQKKKSGESVSISEQRVRTSASSYKNETIDWERIKNTPRPTQRKGRGNTVDGFEVDESPINSSAEMEQYVSEQRMLEDAERELGKNFWLNENLRDSGKYSTENHNNIFQESSSLHEYITSSDMSWFNMEEKEAEAAFVAQYGMMGFTVREAGFGKNALVITSPDGTSEKEIRLFTDNYKRVAGVVGDAAFREEYHINKIKDWMVSQTQGSGFIEEVFRTGDRKTVFGLIQGTMSYATTPMGEDIKWLRDNLTVHQMTAMHNGTTFSPLYANKILTEEIVAVQNQIKGETPRYAAKRVGSGLGFHINDAVAGKDLSRRDALEYKLRRLIDIKDNIAASNQRQSATIGASLLQTQGYKQFDFANNDNDIAVMSQLGLDIRDLPFDQLTVNGRPSTYNEIYNILTDYDGVRDVRAGRIQIGIDAEGIDGQLAKALFDELSGIQDRNEAVRTKGVLGSDSYISHLLSNTGLNIENFSQNLGISTLGVISDLAYSTYDMARMVGVPEEYASLVFGATSLTPYSISAGHSHLLMHPSNIQHLREEYLPLYNSGITDAESFGEMMAKGGDALAQSLPTSAVFMANPMAGLAVTGVTAYGREMYRLDMEIAEAQKIMDETGEFNDKIVELKTRRAATMSRAEARSYALLMAGVETGYTRLFTYNFFKNAAASKNFQGIKTETNARKLSNAYQKIYYKNFIENTAYRLGVSKEALSKEILEEELIAANTYAVRVAWGLENYDAEKFRKLLLETGASSAFSSIGMAKMAQTTNDVKVNKTVDSYIKRNIRLPEESTVADQHLRASEALEREKNPRQGPNEFDPNNRYFPVTPEGEASIQERGAVRVQKPADSENIKMLEQVVDETASQLNQFEQRKTELINSMTKFDKKNFLDAMAEIERSYMSIENTREGVVGVEALKKLNTAQARARSILLKYPSSISFNYLPNNLKADYMQKAADELIQTKYAKSDNPSYEIRVADPFDEYMVVPYGQLSEDIQYDIPSEEIRQKAVEMYLSDAKKGASYNGDGTIVLPGFNYLDAERAVPYVSREEVDKFNLSGELEFIRNLQSQGKIDFSKPVERVEKTDELETQEMLDFTQGQKPVSETTVEEEVVLEAEENVTIENKEEVIGEDMQTGLDIKNALTIKSELSDQQRIDNILGKLEYYNSETDNFMTDMLDKRSQDDLKIFISDVKDGKRGNIGKVESILNAVDIAVDIASQNPDGISIIQENGENPVAQALTNLSQQLYTARGTKSPADLTLATTTVLMQTLIKDAKVGKPFYDLNNEAGRIVDAVKQQVSQVKNTHLESYASDAKNDPDYAEASLLQKKEIENPNSLLNSYEMYALSMLYRLSGEKNMQGIDTEFARTKSLIMQELSILEANYKADPKDEINKGKYLQWKQIVDKLDVKNATSYEYIKTKASSRNANAIDRLAEVQPNEKALERIQDYNRFEPKVLSRYLPTFYNVNDGGAYSDAFGVLSGGESMTSANQTKDVTMPETLGGLNNLRLNPNMFFDQAYGSLQGLEMDIQGRGTYRTLTNLMQNPMFQMMFEGNVRTEKGDVLLSDDYQVMKDIFQYREQIFENDVRYSHRNTKGYGEVQTSVTDLLNASLGATYSFVSAVSLGRVTQNLSQYQSAVAGVTPLLDNRESAAYLRRKNAMFYMGMSNAMSGSASKTEISRRLQSLGAGVYQITGKKYDKDYASNIYLNSRTGLRNSLASELIVNQNKQYPLSYYLRAYNIIETPTQTVQEQGLLEQGVTETGLVKQETLPIVAPQKALPEKQQRLLDGESGNVPPSQADIDAAVGTETKKVPEEVQKRFESYGLPLDALYYPKQFADLISKSNSLSLEILLANGDRAAANATFESLYLDYRLKEGAVYDDGFWARENKNPSKDAINYADQKIDETQTQTTSTSQAGIYSEYAGANVRNLSRLIIPFSRFNMNARSAINNQIAILNDPNIDESQKRQSRKFIEGKVREVAFFRGTAVLGWTAIATGGSGILAAIGAVEREDVERYGGITGYIGDKALPIEERGLIEIPKGALMNAGSVEEMNAVYRQIDLARGNLVMDMIELKSELMTYENKFVLSSYEPELLRDVIQDIGQTVNPIPRPTIADDAFAMMFNEAMELMDIPVEANEFLSNDFKGGNTTDGMISMLSENAGMFSITKQQAENLMRAHQLAGEGRIYKYNPMTVSGEIPVEMSALTPEMRDQLHTATKTLLWLRYANIVAPGLPKAEINKYANRLERQLETIFDAVSVDSDGNPILEYDIHFDESSINKKDRKSVLDN